MGLNHVETMEASQSLCTDDAIVLSESEETLGKMVSCLDDVGRSE